MKKFANQLNFLEQAAETLLHDVNLGPRLGPKVLPGHLLKIVKPIYGLSESRRYGMMNLAIIIETA